MTAAGWGEAGSVAELDRAAAERARHGVDAVAGAAASGLGVMGALATWMAATGGSASDAAVRPRMLLIGTDVGTTPDRFGPAAMLASDAGVEVARLDLPSVNDVQACWDIGTRAVDAAADEGITLLLPSLATAGPSPTAAAGLLGHVPPEDILGIDASDDDNAWMDECAAVRDAMFAARDAVDDPAGLLAALGDGPLACLTAVLLGGARRGVATLVEGTSGAAAALVARRMSPRSAEWWWPASTSGRPAEVLAWRELDRQPLLDLGIRCEAGLGSALALPLARAAAQLARSA